MKVKIEEAMTDKIEAVKRILERARCSLLSLDRVVPLAYRPLFDQPQASRLSDEVYRGIKCSIGDLSDAQVMIEGWAKECADD